MGSDHALASARNRAHTSFRTPWLIGAIACLTLAACGSKKDDKPSTSAGGGKPAGSAAEAPPADDATPASAAAGDLGMLPLDSELVLGANTRQLVASAVWKQLVAPLVMRDEIGSKLGDLKTRCGIDPLAEVSSISAGVKGLDATEPEGVVVVRGLDQAKVTACVDKVKADVADKAEVTREGEVTLIKSARGDRVAFRFVGDSIAVVGFGAKATAAGIEAAAAKKSGLDSAKSFRELFDRVDTKDTVWLVLNGSSSAFDALESLGSRPKAMYGSVAIADGFTARVRFRMGGADQATKLATVTNQQVKPLAGGLLPLQRFDVASDGADVVAHVAVAGDKLSELVDRLEELLGGQFSAGMAP